MAYEFTLPDLGEGLTEGEIARWLVAEGQEIAEDDPLVEIATDKTTVEIPSPAGGTVSRILVREGEVVPVGTLLVVIGDRDRAPGDERPGPEQRGAEQPGPEQPGPEQPTGEPAPRRPAAPPRPSNSLLLGERKVRATPLVRRLASELGVVLEEVAGTGPQGRITEADVRGAAEGGAAAAEGRREPLRGVRRRMFEHLTRAHREVAGVTWVEECDFSNVELGRLVPLVLKAAAASLREFPELNARVEDGELVLLDRRDLGVAVQTEQGLVVPVVRGCDERSLDELDAEVRRLAEAAHAGTLTPGELRGGTFTVTSAGRAGGLLVTPLVNHPEVAILGVHRIDDRPVVREGQVVVRPIGNVSVTFDHRVVDGKRAAEFGLAVIGRLERP